MPSESRADPRRQSAQGGYVPPPPHPSWRGEAMPDLAQPLIAAEFWKRLGL